MWTIEYTTSQLVARHRGTLPVILTCPHNGDAAPEGVPERKGQGLPGTCHFSTRPDLETRLITMGVAQRVLDICGEAPYVVIARFKRAFIDANRPRECAYEVNAAQPFYDAYHGTIRGFIDEIRAENGELGLLFDVHGTVGITSDPAHLYLGTSNGQTVARLLRVDPRALARPRSLRGLLTAAGFVVSPQPGQPETPALDGGHTVRTYGSGNADGLDAFQIEIDDSLRSITDNRNRLIDRLAHAIVSLVPRYADTHTMAAFQSVSVGGGSLNRGRLEARHDPGANGDASRAAVLVLSNNQGNDHYIWVDADGRLRISAEDPQHESDAGTVVGTQA
jgi:N-formylglutamate amidohydrolase